jgi:tRNA pseudouridine55 synthase
MVSALKVDGKRLHELAREGIEIERAARPVRIDRFDVTASSVDSDGRPVLTIEVDCSAGTYIRTLAADLGRLLGSGAHLRRLRRTAVEPFTIAEAAPPDECELLPPIAAVRNMTKVVVDEATQAAIAVGKILPTPAGDSPWAMVTPADDLLAIYEPHRPGTAKPSVVLPAG